MARPSRATRPSDDRADDRLVPGSRRVHAHNSAHCESSVAATRLVTRGSARPTQPRTFLLLPWLTSCSSILGRRRSCPSPECPTRPSSLLHCPTALSCDCRIMTLAGPLFGPANPCRRHPSRASCTGSSSRSSRPGGRRCIPASMSSATTCPGCLHLRRSGPGLSVYGVGSERSDESLQLTSDSRIAATSPPRFI